MGRGSHIKGLSHGDDLFGLQDAANQGNVRLDDVDGTLTEEVLVLPAADQALAGSQRGGDLVGDLAEAFLVLGQDNFLHEHQLVGLQFMGQHLGHRLMHTAVEVDSDAEIIATGLADGGNAVHNGLDLGKGVNVVQLLGSVHFDSVKTHGRMFNMSRDHMRNCCIVLFQFKAGGVIALTLQDSIVKAGLYLPVFQKNFIQLVQSILFTFCFHVCNHTFREKNISHGHLCSSPPFLLYRSAAFAPIQKCGCKGSGTLTPIYVASYVPTFWQNLILF